MNEKNENDFLNTPLRDTLAEVEELRRAVTVLREELVRQWRTIEELRAVVQSWAVGKTRTDTLEKEEDNNA